jgi:hypothetical protein
MRLFPLAAFREQEEQQVNQSLKNYSKALNLWKSCKTRNER